MATGMGDRFAAALVIMIVAATAATGQSAKRGHEFEVLVFTRTEGFRHDSIENGVAAITAIGDANDFTVTHIEDASVFTDSALLGFGVVVFLNTTGDVLDPDQEEAFERFVRGAAGYVGIHSSDRRQDLVELRSQQVGI